MKVAIIEPRGHENRGVGFYTSRLVEALKKYKELELVETPGDNIPEDVCLIHYPFFHPYFITLPVKIDRPTIVTIHDLTPVLFKNHFPPGIKGEIKWQIQKRLLPKVAAVITDSDCSKNDIVKLTNYPEEKIFVVKLAADETFRKITNQDSLNKIKGKYNLPDKFILYVGDVNWNKNIIGLARSCNGMDAPIVIIGRQAQNGDLDKSNIENQPLAELINEFGNDKNVLRLGFVETEDLAGIYNLAALYVQPSFYEGFGLPILEAFACGCLVASSNKGSLPEICKDAAIMFDPEKTGDMEEKIRKAMSLNREERMAYITKGLQISSSYSWQKTAARTTEIYKHVLIGQ